MASFFKNKNILITGIDGFVGRHLDNAIKKSGGKVFGISKSSSRKNVLKADITDFPKVNSFIKRNKISICFHLAGVSLVEQGQLDPYSTLKINTLGTLNILESARINKLERIIIASTSQVYGQNTVPYKEEYFPRPSRPYETSKACIDLIAQSYADTFGLPVLIPRFVNIYGPGDINFNRLIPKTIKAVLSNKKPAMWGGGAVRDYLYIDDAIRGYLMLASIKISSIGKNRIFNFGSENKINVKSLMYKIIALSRSKVEIKEINELRENEISVQYVSSQKARRILRWNAKTSLETGLANTYKWYKKYFNSLKK